MEILIILDNKKILDKEIKLKPLFIKSGVLTLLVIIVIIGVSTPVGASIREPRDFDTRMMEYRDEINNLSECTYRIVTTGFKELVTTMDQEIANGDVPILKPFTIENQKAFLNQLVDEYKNSNEYGTQIIRFFGNFLN